jgi:hypothetical protein
VLYGGWGGARFPFRTCGRLHCWSLGLVGVPLWVRGVGMVAVARFLSFWSCVWSSYHSVVCGFLCGGCLPFFGSLRLLLLSCVVYRQLSWSSSGPLGMYTDEGFSRTRRNYESYDSRDGGSESTLRSEFKRKLGRWPIFPFPLE